MRVDLTGWLYVLRSSFWLIPSLMGLAAIIAAFAVLEADVALGDRSLTFPPGMTMPIESARLALSTIAGSMITIASLVFSMTLVALTLVSQQLGPRILMLFMDDRETQIMLGLFVATFVFALIVLLRVGDEEIVGRVPALAVVCTAGLAIFALGMMIRFIHHIATRIQADVLIAELGRDLISATERFAKHENEHQLSDDDLRKIETRTGSMTSISLPISGYLRRLDSVAACTLAHENGLVLRMIARPGEFILSGTPIFSVVLDDEEKAVSDDLHSELCALAMVGDRRTPEASVEFELAALVEVALRALSPGINDPFTASACIDRLADGLRTLMRRSTEQRVTCDQSGIIRVIHPSEPFDRYLSVAYDAISEMGRSNPITLSKLKSVLSDLEHIADNDHQKEALNRFKEGLQSANSG